MMDLVDSSGTMTVSQFVKVNANGEQYITLPDVAKLLHVTRRTLTNYASLLQPFLTKVHNGRGYSYRPDCVPLFQTAIQLVDIEGVPRQDVLHSIAQLSWSVTMREARRQHMGPLQEEVQKRLAQDMIVNDMVCQKRNWLQRAAIAIFRL